MSADPWKAPPLWNEPGWTALQELEFLAFYGVPRIAAERTALGLASMREACLRMMTNQEMGRLTS